jgi:hypothetical protein
MIFFGANDSVSDAPSQRRVSIEEYKANLIEIVTHPATRLQNPRTMLVTPPPINEYQRVVEDRKKGYHHIRRTARTTKKYAEACLGIAKGLGVVGVDIWSAFMREAGWEEGQPLAGSMETPQNPVLERLMYDGMYIVSLEPAIKYTEFYGVQGFTSLPMDIDWSIGKCRKPFENIGKTRLRRTWQ